MQAVTLATAVGAFSFSIQAQYRAPQPERKTPRAVGVVETFKNGSRRLVPVTFYYEKKFYDAALYHATPVPFTLYSETVYEVQQFGKPLGTFTLQSASRSGDEASTAWFGNGRFKAAPDAATLAKKAAVSPVVVEDPSRPVLHRREGSEGDNPGAHPSVAKVEAEEDPDRPKLHKRAGSGSTETATASGADQPADKKQAGGDSPDTSGQDPNRPKLHRKDEEQDTKTAAKASGSKVVAAKAELTPNDDPDHPVLRRGKPVQEQGGRDLPDFKKEEPVTRQVAISDASPSEVQPLIYVSNETERTKLEELARELARAELRRMAAQRGLTMPGAGNMTAGAREKASRQPEKAGRDVGHQIRAKVGTQAVTFKEEQFVPYDLDYSNRATVVFSGRYVPEAATGTGEASSGASGGNQGRSWVVTVVAKQEEDKLVKLYSSVSDPRELDLYPEVLLVDALDPDGYGRSALLFREKKRDGVSWLLGRPTGYELQTLVETASR